IVGPAGMPRELVAKVNALLVQALSSPDVKEFIARGAYEATPSTPAELSLEMKLAYDRWGAMVKQIGFEKQ
ncbi:MAG TPA: tripartite tricarboxylate transporter substrate binding protein, partial [Burkholderiaceae bacterium]|nr:tripartite tricarboxylate transporter substrate binding protein [Burkholderiaceae bacterium]